MARWWWWFWPPPSHLAYGRSWSWGGSPRRVLRTLIQWNWNAMQNNNNNRVDPIKHNCCSIRRSPPLTGLVLWWWWATSGVDGRTDGRQREPSWAFKGYYIVIISCRTVAQVDMTVINITPLRLHRKLIKHEATQERTRQRDTAEQQKKRNCSRRGIKNSINSVVEFDIAIRGWIHSLGALFVVNVFLNGVETFLKSFYRRRKFQVQFYLQFYTQNRILCFNRPFRKLLLNYSLNLSINRWKLTKQTNNHLICIQSHQSFIVVHLHQMQDSQYPRFVIHKFISTPNFRHVTSVHTDSPKNNIPHCWRCSRLGRSYKPPSAITYSKFAIRDAHTILIHGSIDI